MKKFISVFMAGVLIFSFAGCQTEKETDVTTAVVTDAQGNVIEESNQGADGNETNTKKNNKDKNQKNEKENETVKKVEFEGRDEILKAWTKYLKVNEKKLSSVIWGTTYIKNFCKKPDVTGYRRAMAAAETVAGTLKKIEIPKLSVSNKAFSSAVKAGKDLSFINTDFAGLKNDIVSDAELWESLSRSIVTDSFWSYGTEYLEAAADLEAKQAQAYIEYLRYSTNYLLLTVGENSFISDVCGACPTIFKSTDKYIKDTATIEKKISASLDKLESCISDHANIKSIQNANNAVMKKAVTSGNYNKVYSVALSWGKGKDVIPMPSWDSLPCFYSYKLDSSDEVKWTSVGDNLTQVPPSLMAQFEGVKKADFISYIEMIYSLGFKLASAEGSYDGTTPMQLIFQKGNIEVSMGWEDNYVTILIIDAKVVLCPLWYYIYINE